MIEHVRLWDNEYRLIWDSQTATTPAYQHISTQVNATIDYGDWRTRWNGIFYRCPEGIQRMRHADLVHDLRWPTIDELLVPITDTPV